MYQICRLAINFQFRKEVVSLGSQSSECGKYHTCTNLCFAKTVKKLSSFCTDLSRHVDFIIFILYKLLNCACLLNFKNFLKLLQKVIIFYQGRYKNKRKLNLFKYHKNVIIFNFNNCSLTNPRKEKIRLLGWEVFPHTLYSLW